MKSLNKILLASVSFILAFSSCQYEDKFDELPAQKYDPLQDNIEATMTCKYMRDLYIGNVQYLLTENPHSNNYAKMFNVSAIPENAEAIIRGIVVSTDVDGNTYKKIVIRDEKDGSGLDISIDASGLSAFWPQGQRVAINAAGLHIGDYANFPAMGYQTYNRKRGRYEVGRLPFTIAKDHIKALGLPDTLLSQPEEVTIDEIMNNKEYYYSRLVKIKNVQFGYYMTSSTNPTPNHFQNNNIKLIDDIAQYDSDGDLIPDDENDDIPPFSIENDLNVPVSRAIKDANGKTTNVTTSFYAKFAAKKLKRGRHDVVAIVAWYKDKGSSSGNIQLLIQKFSDITPTTVQPETK